MNLDYFRDKFVKKIKKVDFFLINKKKIKNKEA